MPKLEFVTTKGQPFHVQFAEPARQEHVFLLSVAKSGSSLLYSMIGGYLTGVGMPFTDIPSQIFQQGIVQGDLPATLYEAIDAHPSIYLGFRTMFGLERCRMLIRSKRLVLVRDPRDALVSHYYSIRQSHMLPVKGDNRRNMLQAREEAASTGIDHFITQVQRGKFICKTMLSLSRLNGPDTHVYKYEDVIFNKAAWLRDMLSRIDIGQLDEELIEKIAARNDIIPENEDPSRHIRQVKPGNYKNHLSPETIKWIERQYSDVFDAYGYPKSSAS